MSKHGPNAMAGDYKEEQLHDYVEAWCIEKGIELVFSANERNTGRLVPEYDHIFILNGRKVGEITLCHLIRSDLLHYAMKTTASDIKAVLTRLAWDHYIKEIEYPEWMKYEGIKRPKRKRGRPRTKPKVVAVDSETDR